VGVREECIRGLEPIAADGVKARSARQRLRGVAAREVAGYRDPAPPAPLVTKLRVTGPLERGFDVLGVGLALASAFAIAQAYLLPEALNLAASCVLTAMSASAFAFGRYGRARADIEIQPGSGAITLVTQGFLTLSRRTELHVDEIAAIRIVRIANNAQAFGEPLAQLSIESTDGDAVDVFGRPLGLPDGEARRIAALLEKQIRAARQSTLPPTRVAVDAHDLDEARPRRARSTNRER
jgi:hypothetical protein